MNNVLYVIKELKLQRHFYMLEATRNLCKNKKLKMCNKNTMQNAKPTAPARCVGGGRCPRGVCVRRVRGIGLSTLNSQVSTKNHNNIVTNIPPDLRLKFIANTQNYWGTEKLINIVPKKYLTIICFIG